MFFARMFTIVFLSHGTTIAHQMLLVENMAFCTINTMRR